MQTRHIQKMLGFIREKGVQEIYNKIEETKEARLRAVARHLFEEAFKILKTGDYRFKNTDWPTSQS